MVGLDQFDQMNHLYHKDSSTVTRNVADETILVPIRKNLGDMESIYVLNETATRSWELFDGRLTLDQICDQIAEEFDVDRPIVENDILELVEQLEGIGALVLDETVTGSGK